MLYIFFILLILSCLIEYSLSKENDELRTRKLTVEMKVNKLEDDLRYIKKKKDLLFYKQVEIEKLIERTDFKSIEDLKEEIKKILKTGGVI